MTVTGFDFVRRERVAGGMAFADVGPYEELSGIVRFAIDPADPTNAAITDLALAPTGRDGLIRCNADLVLARPCEPPARGALLVDLPNRGRPSATRWLNDAKGFPAPSANDVGSGFLMRQGFTIARGGWQFDVPDEPGRLRLRGPAAERDGRPVTGLTLCQFQLEASANGLSLSDREHRPYPAADPNEPGALLTVRTHASATPTAIPRVLWRFARSDDSLPVADPAHVWLEGGFQPGLLYELTYTATGALVVGLGMLAIRDVVAWLLRGTAAQGNPCAGELHYAIAYGESQTGRLLREMLYHGLNRDEDGRKVLDGMLINVAGARRGEFNVRFGQPSKTLGDGVGALFPFHDVAMVDTVSGRRDGLLARAQRFDCVPKVITMNTSTEYWGGDRSSGGQSSLLHTDPAASLDVEPPDTSRVYLVAGAQHLPSVWPKDDVTHLGIRCAQTICALDHRPVQRALLMALDRWVAHGEEPPRSRVPRLADGTAITPEAALEKLAMMPGLVRPAHLPELRRIDFGFTASGVPTRLPPSRGERYPWFVSAVDADGNEVAGIRHPDIAVPLATYVGFNVRHANSAALGELVPAAGAIYPFAATVDERRRAGDRRPSIVERYPDRETYLQKVREATRTLVEDGFVLGEDVGRIVEEAGAKHDAFVGKPVASATSAVGGQRDRSRA